MKKKRKQKNVVKMNNISTKKEVAMGIKKQYIESGKICRVMFQFSVKAAPKASVVSIAGDFNNWHSMANIMNKNDGNYSVTLDLKPGKEYEYRFLIDNTIWENDWNADKYAPNPYGCENSVVVV